MNRRSALCGSLAALVAGLGLFAAGGAQAQPAAVVGFGSAISDGAPVSMAAPVAAMASTRDGKGYWLLGADGGVFAYGDARYSGSATGDNVGIPMVGIAPTPDDRGYWVSDFRGRVLHFGDAPYIGELDTAVVLPSVPVVGMASDPIADGFWQVAADGGVFAFGDARFHGSLGATHLAAPIVSIAATPDGKGYWLAAADGGVFAFGDARFHGSEGGDPASSATPVVAISSSAGSQGYWLATTDKALPSAGPVPTVASECDQYGGPAQVEPIYIVLACGDGNEFIDQLQWSSWTATGAVGTGDFNYNLCQPDCADGVFASEPTEVHLSYPIESGAGPQFSSVTYTSGGRSVSELLEVTPVG